MSGWISLHRSLLGHKLWKAEPFTKGQAWVDILLLTNHNENIMTVKNGTMINVKRGECGYSELALGDRWKWSRGKVKRFLQLLKTEKMIHLKSIENRTIIVICNYDQFQTDSKQNSKRTVNEHLTGHQTDINNKENKENNADKGPGIFDEPEPKSKKPKPVIEYPTWLDQEKFNEFIQDRKDRKCAATPRAIKGLITALDKACNGDRSLQGQIIEKAITNSWKSFFALRKDEIVSDPTQEEGYMTPQQIHDNIRWDNIAKIKAGEL